MGDFFHVFWTCPIIAAYKNSVDDITGSVAHVPLTPSLIVCLLGLVDDLLTTTVGKTLIELLQFYSRKALTLHWKKPSAPTITYYC